MRLLGCDGADNSPTTSRDRPVGPNLQLDRAWAAWRRNFLPVDHFWRHNSGAAKTLASPIARGAPLARIKPIRPRDLPLLTAGIATVSVVVGLAATTPRCNPKATMWVGGCCFVNMTITAAAMMATSRMWAERPAPKRR